MRTLAQHTPDEIRGTLALLSYFKRFMKSDCSEALDPYEPHFERRLTKAEAAERLSYILDVATNRRGGLADVPSRKWETQAQTDMQRDYRALHEPHGLYNLPFFGHRKNFYTRACRERFQHLLERFRED